MTTQSRKRKLTNSDEDSGPNKLLRTTLEVEELRIIARGDPLFDFTARRDNESKRRMSARRIDPIDEILNTASLVKWHVPGKCKNTNTPKFYWQVIQQAKYLEDDTTFKCHTEIWTVINARHADLYVTSTNGDPVPFESMNSHLSEKQRKSRGPFYYPDKFHASHVLYKLRFKQLGGYKLVWSSDGETVIANRIHVTGSPAKDDTSIGAKTSIAVAPQPIPTSPTVQALLPANYVIKYKDNTTKSLSNVMFLVPEDQHRDCIFHVLQQLGYQYTTEDSWFFLLNDDCNVLMCSAGYFIRNRSYRKYFNEYLLFIAGVNRNSISSVSKVTKPGAPDIDLKIKIGAAVTVDFNQLTIHQQAMIRLFQQPYIKGYAAVIDAVQDATLEPLYEYISSWLFSLDPVEQKDIFIQIKVDGVDVDASANQVANDLFEITQQHLAPLAITREAHMHGCVLLIISGPPITWWLINEKRQNIALDLAQRGLNLLDISLVDTKQIILTLKKDLRNKQYAKQVFALICKTLENSVTEDCVRLNTPSDPKMFVTSAPIRRPRRPLRDLVTRNQVAPQNPTNADSQIKESGNTTLFKHNVKSAKLIDSSNFFQRPMQQTNVAAKK